MGGVKRYLRGRPSHEAVRQEPQGERREQKEKKEERRRKEKKGVKVVLKKKRKTLQSQSKEHVNGPYA
jgi:hypothetical protein